MTSGEIDKRKHSHVFGQDEKRPGEARTFVVIAITSAMMLIEIAAGLAYGSMALFADGLHMASHAAALSISAFAYVYARRHAHDERFNFGTGKVNALGGFTGAVLLAVFALMMAWESVDRLIHPVEIQFNQAILVAVIGLIVNGASMLILGNGGHAHDHGHDHSHGAGDHHHHHHHHHDHSLRSAYLHVLADTLTSLLAIFALLAAKYFGLIWMDPVMAIIGATLVARWSLGLLRSTSSVLLDLQASAPMRQAIQDAIENEDGAHVADLHVWSIGPNIYAACLSIVADAPRSVDHYQGLLPDTLGLVHVTIEIHPAAKD